MKRFDTWPERLAAFIEARRMMPFCWGTNDCALFACDAGLEMTGIDLAADFRGKYGMRREAGIEMKLYVGRARKGAHLLEQVAEKVAKAHDLEEINPRFAHRGDIALFKNAKRIMLGVVDLSGCFIVAPGKNELLKAPLADARRAWRIP